MNIFRRVQHIGPGGMKCPCCGPAPSYRDKNRRVARRRIKEITRKEIRDAKGDDNG